MSNIAEAPQKTSTKEPAVVEPVLTDKELRRKTRALISIFKGSEGCKIAVLLNGGNGDKLNSSLRRGRNQYFVDFSGGELTSTLDVKRSLAISPQIGGVVQIIVTASPDKNSIEYLSSLPFQKQIQIQRDTDSAYQNAAGFLKHF